MDTHEVARRTINAPTRGVYMTIYDSAGGPIPPEVKEDVEAFATMIAKKYELVWSVIDE